MSENNDKWCDEIVVSELLRERSINEIDTLHRNALKMLSHIASDCCNLPVNMLNEQNFTKTTFAEMLEKGSLGHIYLYKHLNEQIILNMPIPLIDHMTSVCYGAKEYKPAEGRTVSGWFEQKMANSVVVTFSSLYPRMWSSAFGFSVIPDGFMDIHKIPFDPEIEVLIFEYVFKIENETYPVQVICSDTLIENLYELKEDTTQDDNINRLQSVELELKAVMMKKEMSIKELSRIEVGSLIPLPTINPIDIELTDGKVVAQGTLGKIDTQKVVKIDFI